MQKHRTWQCDACGKVQPLRRIDDHRWVSPAEAKGLILTGTALAYTARKLQLCPACRLRLVHKNIAPQINIANLNTQQDEE